MLRFVEIPQHCIMMTSVHDHQIQNSGLIFCAFSSLWQASCYKIGPLPKRQPVGRAGYPTFAWIRRITLCSLSTVGEVEMAQTDTGDRDPDKVQSMIKPSETDKCKNIFSCMHIVGLIVLFHLIYHKEYQFQLS